VIATNLREPLGAVGVRNCIEIPDLRALFNECIIVITKNRNTIGANRYGIKHSSKKFGSGTYFGIWTTLNRFYAKESAGTFEQAVASYSSQPLCHLY